MTNILALLVIAAGCEQNSAATTPSGVVGTTAAEAPVRDASTGATISAPQLVSPPANKQFKFLEQPIVLTITNAVTTGSSPLTYTFEVATDSGFASKVYSKDVAAGSSGQTSVTIDKLAASKVYFWRARSNAGTVAGPYSGTRSFEVGAEPILQTPQLAAPANGSTVSGAGATLITNNAGKSGPIGQVFYRFDVSDSAAFNRIVLSGSVAEQGTGQTSFTLATTSLSSGTYYWRVQASDPSNGLTTANSSTFSFVYQPFNMSQATIWDNPPDMGSWPEAASITSIHFTDSAFLVDFDKRDGPGRWPDVGFGAGSIEYTLGMCLNISSQWNCSAVVQFWYGRELEASGRPDEIGINWFYDNRWGAMLGHQPAWGETVGVFVAAGNQRDSGNTIVKERSNVVMIPWGQDYLPGAGGQGAFVRRAKR
jgi:hypothetical protein